MEAEKEPARWEVGAMRQVHLCGHLKKPVSKGKRGRGLIWDLRCSGKHLQVWGQGSD